MIINYNYKNIPHSINIDDNTVSKFEKYFFPLNKYSILTLISEDEEINNIDKYLINAIEECVY